MTNEEWLEKYLAVRPPATPEQIDALRPILLQMKAASVAQAEQGSQSAVSAPIAADPPGPIGPRTEAARRPATPGAGS